MPNASFGGMLVSAKVNDEHLALVQGALEAVPAIEIATCGVACRQAGWTCFDDEAAPCPDEEVAAERRDTTPAFDG